MDWGEREKRGWRLLEEIDLVVMLWPELILSRSLSAPPHFSLRLAPLKSPAQI